MHFSALYHKYVGLKDQLDLNHRKMNYEMMFILQPDLGEAKTEAEIAEIKNLITSHGGKIQHEDNWGVRDLAYRIKKQDQGYYVVLNFELDTKHVKELELPLNINQAVLRYMILSTPKNYSFKTLAEYEKEAAATMKEEVREKEEKASARRAPVVKKKDEVKKKEETSKTEEKKKKEEKPAKKSAKAEDFDEKLKNIINDPDISL